MNASGHRQSDPLARIGDQLVAAARRRTSARRRRRRGLVVAALAGALLMLTGAALGVSGVNTGVPVIDDLIDEAPTTADSPLGDGRFPAGSAPPKSGFSPTDAKSVSPPWRVTVPDGTQRTVVGYTTDEGICIATADLGDRRPDSRGCNGGNSFRRAMRRTPALVSFGGGPGPFVSFSGFARANVKAIVARTPTQRAEAQLSPPWKADPSTTVKMFYVFLDGDRGDFFRDLPPLDFQATLEDGRTVPLGP